MAQQIQLIKRTDNAGDTYFETHINGKYAPDTIVYGGNASSTDEYRKQQLEKAMIIYQGIVEHRTPSIEVLMQTNLH